MQTKNQIQHTQKIYTTTYLLITFFFTPIPAEKVKKKYNEQRKTNKVTKTNRSKYMEEMIL